MKIRTNIIYKNEELKTNDTIIIFAKVFLTFR